MDQKWNELLANFLYKHGFLLDKFHLHQSLTRIEKNKEIRNKLFEYIVVEQDRLLFNEAIKILIENTPLRKESIQKEQKYLLNNWQAIQRAHHKVKMGCSMESAISHYIASSLTSVPKAYEKENLSIYLNYRQHAVNKKDIAKLYIQSLDYKEVDGIKVIKEPFDFSFFETQRHRNDKSFSSNWVKGFISKH